MSALATPSLSSSADPGTARSRGLGWVVTQFVLIAVVILAGFVPPDWPDSVQGVLSVVGTVLAIAGGGFAAWAAKTLGRYEGYWDYAQRVRWRVVPCVG
jgi:protein-S-isoprenylcysteine O-methyltransferase Ste14